MSSLTNSNRLSIVYPKLCTEWDYEKNYPLTPSDVSYSSHREVGWKCPKCGRTWMAAICKRNNGGNDPDRAKCRHCSSRKMSNKNRLSVAYPELCKQWDYEKNGNLRPEDVCYSSSIEVYWKCKEGHSWKESVTSRTSRLNIICDICLSFGFKHPELIKEWHPTKNGKLTPYDVRELSTREVWWICKNGHAYKCSPCDRISWGRKCFVCRSLEFQNPKLAAEWHPTKNGKLKPSKLGIPFTLVADGGIFRGWMMPKRRKRSSPRSFLGT